MHLFNTLKFILVFKDFFNKLSCNFDDDSKGLLKYRLWRHTFCPLRHQQNFIT